MSVSKKFIISGQFLIAIVVLLGLNYSAQANAENSDFKPSYKVDQCDCFSFNENIPTFLSDLTGGSVDVFGEGGSLNEAKKQAQNMCMDSYRAHASVNPEKAVDVTESGCHQYRSNIDGGWDSI